MYNIQSDSFDDTWRSSFGIGRLGRRFCEVVGLHYTELNLLEESRVISSEMDIKIRRNE